MSTSGYPAAPWRLRGQMWGTLFAVSGGPGRPRGRYAAAFVSYEPDSPLTYSELLVARSLGGTRVQVTDIWVDSPASRAGGRELWAIPKELADFGLDTRHTGPLSRTEWTARVPTGSVGRRAVATARFTDASRAGVRLPLRGGTRQPPLAPGGRPVTAAVTGSAKVLPGRGHWDFDADGPLGWLRGARQLGSFRLCDFRLSFG
jgi:acetoacetate decarboxylase